MATGTHLPIADPFPSEPLQEIRTAKVRKPPGIPYQTAIGKQRRTGRVKITFLGCESDEQTPEFHGGVDRALLQYCSLHYKAWMNDLPSIRHLFTPGGFGENLVAIRANEHNVCIGDVIAIGEEVVVQVSLPRQPCYKLNHRFQVKDISRRTQQLGRTGWLYRVLAEGHIQEGDLIRLVERKHPKWTIANIQHYLHRETGNVEAMRELVGIPELGEEIKLIFRSRLDRSFEKQDLRLFGRADYLVFPQWREYKILEKRVETRRITSLRLQVSDPVENPKAAEPGSHTRLKLGNGLTRTYSVVGGDENCFELGILLEEKSRGGSSYLHHDVKTEDSIQAGRFLVSFPLASEAKKHVLIAGGIGITAFLAAAHQLEASNTPYEFHLCVRSSNDIPFKAQLEKLSIQYHIGEEGDRLDIPNLLDAQEAYTHVYCCGPDRMVDEVASAAKSLGWDEGRVHFEAFSTDSSGDPFVAKLVESNKSVNVGPNQSLLEALREAGLDIDSSCEAGNCGTCRVDYKCGRIDHRGTALLEAEKKESMLACVSRGVGVVELEL
ncbi:hypothetical protein FQN55_006230 [Onygenales sp. PD_40]|nr:hypothetical protein FQN55_006230 [Onygenales sp. PD_40]